eukprot:gene1212-23058_t
MYAMTMTTKVSSQRRLVAELPQRQLTCPTESPLPSPTAAPRAAPSISPAALPAGWRYVGNAGCRDDRDRQFSRCQYGEAPPTPSGERWAAADHHPCVQFCDASPACAVVEANVADAYGAAPYAFCSLQYDNASFPDACPAPPAPNGGLTPLRIEKSGTGPTVVLASADPKWGCWARTGWPTAAPARA